MATPTQTGTAREAASSSLFLTKSIDRLREQAARNPLKPTLGPWSLVSLGIGAIIGAGLFVRTAAAIADRAGPSVVLAFILAGIGCAFAGLCYAEFASMIPIAGSAYTYSYATTVAIAWSQYFNRVLGFMNMSVPWQWYHSPFQTNTLADGTIQHGIMNIPAVGILLMLSLLLIRGT